VLVSLLVFTGVTTVFANPAFATDGYSCDGPPYVYGHANFNVYLTYNTVTYARYNGVIYQQRIGTETEQLTIYVAIDDMAADGHAPYFYLKMYKVDGSMQLSSTYYNRLSAAGGWACVYATYSASTAGKYVDHYELYASTANSSVPVLKLFWNHVDI
jgi:hypothetical protein